MRRTHVRNRRIAAVLVAGLVLLPVAARAGAGPEGGRPHRYVVRPGDTLWSIARRTGGGEDPRPLVDAIAESNHMDAERLVPGQTLLIPAF